MGNKPEVIPYASFGRSTPALRITRSLLPIGVVPFSPKPAHEVTEPIRSDDPDLEKHLMRIVATAIQVEESKLITTGEAIASMRPGQAEPFVLAYITREIGRQFVVYKVTHAVHYVDPRTNAPNPTVDLAVVLVPAISTPEVPYEMKPIRWGDSTNVGVGDPVMIAGYPLGTDLFLEYRSNRGFVQPTVYNGTVGAIIPALGPSEVRLFRITVPGIGGISGGAVFNPKNGEVLGMVTTSMHAAALPQPVIYAIPSEILRPFVTGITFETE